MDRIYFRTPTQDVARGERNVKISELWTHLDFSFKKKKIQLTSSKITIDRIRKQLRFGRKQRAKNEKKKIKKNKVELSFNPSKHFTISTFCSRENGRDGKARLRKIFRRDKSSHVTRL